MKTPDQMASNWSQGLSSGQAATKYKQSIEAFTGNPMALAASDAAMASYAAGVQRSITSGKRKRKLLAADPGLWKKNALEIGATNLTNGAAKGQAKMVKHFQDWASTYAQASSAARALPKGGIGNAMARVRASMEVLMKKAGTA